MKYLWLALLAVVAIACTKKNEGVCCTTDTDCKEFGLPSGSSCGDGFVCEGHLCVEASCGVDADCPGAQPVCNAASLSCGSCEADPDCERLDDTPRCNVATGGCQECVTNDQCEAGKPVCDAGACRTCALDSECSSTVCNVDIGT
jgi:hypothetical protein